MALTKNGLRVGKAGASDLADMREYIQIQQDEFRERWLDAVDSLVGLLGDGFDEWWDSYPATMTKEQFLPIMLAKIEEVSKNKLAEYESWYGKDLEATATEVHNLIEAAEAGDKYANEIAEHAEWLDNERTMREAAV